MPYKLPKVRARELAALRRAAENPIGRFTPADRVVANEMAGVGLAVPVDSHGRVIFPTGVYAVIGSDSVIATKHCGGVEFFLTPVGAERARYAADGYETHGDPVDPSLMEDL